MDQFSTGPVPTRRPRSSRPRDTSSVANLSQAVERGLFDRVGSYWRQDRKTRGEEMVQTAFGGSSGKCEKGVVCGLGIGCLCR